MACVVDGTYTILYPIASDQITNICFLLSRSGKRQKICQIVAMKIRGSIFCSGELDRGLCCQWNIYHKTWT